MALTKVTGQVIKNTTDVTVGVLTVTNTLAVGGTVSIGGTLTYEDVTNVDAVGLITARNGIVVGSGITLSKDGDGFFTGVTTATTFVGNLTGDVTGDVTGTASQVTISGGSDNRVLTAGSANTIQAESNININGGILIAGHTASTLTSNGEGPFLQVKATDSRGGASFIRHSADAGACGLYIGKSRNATIGSNTIVQSGDELGRITFSGDDGTDINTEGAKIVASVDGTPGSNDMPGRLMFYTTADGAASPTERVRINSSGDIGIGVNAPVARLEVNSTRNAETDRHSAANYHLALRNPEDDNGEAIGLSFGITSNTTKVGAAILHERDGGGSQGSLQFYTSSDGNSLTERMRVQANGRVNIGVNANVGAQSLLNLKGSGDDGNQTVLLRLGNDSSGSGTGAAMVMGAGAGASSQGVTLAGFYDGTGTTFTLGTNASFNGSTTERFRITKDGYLGLGAGSNTNKPLHIYTGSSDSEIRLQTNSGTEQNSYISLRQSNGDLDFYTVNAASMKFHTTNTERVKIHAAGYFTKAYQPFFSVYGSASNVTYNDGDEIDFENAIHNDGSHFKMTSGTGQYKRFIAPVAGIYIFTFGFFPNTASGCRISLAVNGSVQTNPYISGCFSNWGTGQPAPMATQMLKLSASDYVTVKIQSGTLTNTYDGHTGFQGYLLG